MSRKGTLYECMMQSDDDGLPPVSIPIVLVGNKSDLHLDRLVSKEDGQKLAQTMKAAFLETSARNNQVDLHVFLPLALYYVFVCFSCRQGVSEVFHKVLTEMEQGSADHSDGGKTCVVS